MPDEPITKVILVNEVRDEASRSAVRDRRALHLDALGTFRHARTLAHVAESDYPLRVGEARISRVTRPSLAEFCFASPKVFLIPAEHLSPTGMSAPFARLLTERRTVPSQWIDRFNEAFSLYFERVSDLADKAPDYWRKPRTANICVVRDPIGTRPYYLPFAKTSWLLYENDFDPDGSSPEFGAYQFAHVERLAATGDPSTTWLHNLGYFLERSDAERASFVAGCTTSTRPDADAFRTLATLMTDIVSFTHDQLGPSRASAEGTARIAFAGLNVPEAHQATCQTIAKSFRAEAHNATYRYFQAQQSSDPTNGVDELLQWLANHAPKVLVTDQFGGTLWDCDRPRETDALRAVLEEIAPPAVTSLTEDWALIDRHSRAFLSALVDPTGLEFPEHGLDQADGVFLHSGRKMIAYSLVQPGLQSLAEEAPPYHRLLVGARTIHEWGHLAAEAGIVCVPDHLADTHSEQHQRLIGTFDEIVANAPDPFRAMAKKEVDLLAQDGCHLGDMPLRRIGDYQANLLAREFLSAPEMEAYARANVGPLLDEDGVGPYLALARHAYEYQYLRLTEIEDPFAYFLATTWFGPTYFETGIVSQPQTRNLFDTVSALFDCYEVDRTKMRGRSPTVASMVPT